MEKSEMKWPWEDDSFGDWYLLRLAYSYLEGKKTLHVTMALPGSVVRVTLSGEDNEQFWKNLADECAKKYDS